LHDKSMTMTLQWLLQVSVGGLGKNEILGLQICMCFLACINENGFHVSLNLEITFF
jgi:hypothetical protein